jgi:hypothetical protein
LRQKNLCKINICASNLELLDLLGRAGAAAATGIPAQRADHCVVPAKAPLSRENRLQ